MLYDRCTFGRFNYINMIICSLLEITNGIYLIASSDISASVKAAFILTANAFGGISTLMQTIGIAGTSNNNNGINIKIHIPENNVKPRNSWHIIITDICILINII